MEDTLHAFGADANEDHAASSTQDNSVIIDKLLKLKLSTRLIENPQLGLLGILPPEVREQIYEQIALEPIECRIGQHGAFQSTIGATILVSKALSAEILAVAIKKRTFSISITPDGTQVEAATTTYDDRTPKMIYESGFEYSRPLDGAFKKLLHLCPLQLEFIVDVDVSEARGVEIPTEYDGWMEADFDVIKCLLGENLQRREDQKRLQERAGRQLENRLQVLFRVHLTIDTFIAERERRLLPFKGVDRMDPTYVGVRSELSDRWPRESDIGFHSRCLSWRISMAFARMQIFHMIRSNPDIDFKLLLTESSDFKWKVDNHVNLDAQVDGEDLATREKVVEDICEYWKYWTSFEVRIQVDGENRNIPWTMKHFVRGTKST